MSFRFFLRSYNFFVLAIVFTCILLLYYLSIPQKQDVNLKLNRDLLETQDCRNSVVPNPNDSNNNNTTSNTPILVSLLPTKSISNIVAVTVGVKKSNLEKGMDVFNRIGNTSTSAAAGENLTTYVMVEKLMDSGGLTDMNSVVAILSRLKIKYEEIQRQRHNVTTEIGLLQFPLSNRNLIDHSSNSSASKTKTKAKGKTVVINLAVVACGKRRTEATAMLKSALLFAQDALVHIIMFSDKSTMLNIAADLLELKWTENAGGRDFTFELHLDWFPSDQINHWKHMYQPCATQRLFFPSVLPHIDSLLYLDTDIIVVSNLTEFWLQISQDMKDVKMAGMAPNNEPTARGWYNIMSKIPYYKPRGLNAGVMLMNLTQLRNFSLEAKSLATLTVYKEKIELADQDILNILFHGYPEKLHVFDCSYNFNWVHCGIPGVFSCINNTTGDSDCFCTAASTSGIKIIHGNRETFHTPFHKFLNQVYEGILKFDLLQDSPIELFENLKKKFNELPQKTCHPLTANILYDNALKYLKNLPLKSP